MVQYLVGAGFYVIPAYMPADSSADQIVAANPDVYARNWANLWTAITEVPTFNSTLRGGCPTALFCSPAAMAPQSLQAALSHAPASFSNTDWRALGCHASVANVSLFGWPGY